MVEEGKLEPGSQVQQQWRERMREVESKSWEKKNEKEMVKILGIWGFLLVLIIDCFMVNFLDQICSLSCWILVYLKDNDVIFGTIDFI